ncbi:M24 family metallopeptidase [Chloroflexota bacterium]
MDIPDRIKKLREKLVEKEVDGILISQQDNRRYLSGFDGSAGYLLITHQDVILATDFRYVEQSKRQAPDYKLFQITGKMSEWFMELISGRNLKRLGFEAEDVTFAIYQQLSDILRENQLNLQFVPLDGLVESLRAIKDAQEIKLITRAIEITDKAVEYIEEIIHPSMTELEVAWELERFQREHGSQALPFDVIVASGPNAALPHAQPSKHKIKEGEPVLIDIGARVDGYVSDLSRTICLGSPDDNFKKVYDIVLGAQLATIELIKEGMTGEEADNMARIVIEQSGYGDTFGHSLGHGVGLAEHEQPRLGPRSSDILTSGMVFSIEPGIYISGWGGVRIEDLAVLVDGKIKVLSKAHKLKTRGV